MARQVERAQMPSKLGAVVWPPVSHASHGSCSSVWTARNLLGARGRGGSDSDSSGPEPSEAGPAASTSALLEAPSHHGRSLATMQAARWRNHEDKSPRKRPHGEGEALKLHGEKEQDTAASRQSRAPGKCSQLRNHWQDQQKDGPLNSARPVTPPSDTMAVNLSHRILGVLL